MLEEQRVEAQQTLDQLFSEGLLPFPLSAHKLESIGNEEYIVRFDDSRLSSVDLSWHKDQCFKDVFRAALLERVGRLSGPFQRKLSQRADVNG